MNNIIHTAHTNIKEEIVREGDMLFEVKRRIWFIAFCRFLQWAILTSYFFYNLHKVSIINAFLSCYGLLILAIVFLLEWLIKVEISYSFFLGRNNFIWFQTKNLVKPSNQTNFNKYCITISDISINGLDKDCNLILTDGKKYPWGKRKITICEDFSKNSTHVLDKIEKMKYYMKNSKLIDKQRNSDRFITNRYFIKTELSTENLDQSLSKGWFRMQQHFFTTHFIYINHQYQSAIWLRYNLKHLPVSLKKINLIYGSEEFEYEVVSFKINNTYQELFLKHQESYGNNIYPTLEALLFGNSQFDRFNSFVINIYDKTRLIGAKIFDIGNSSAAGIVSFFDPEYSKYSLSDLMTYRAIDYCTEKGLAYFYPGYFVPGITGFPYKMEIYHGALEFFRISTSSWRSLHSFSSLDIPLDEMIGALNDLQGVLIHNDINALMVTNTGFQTSDNLENYPILLLCSTTDESDCDRAITYNCIDKKYYCYHLPQSEVKLDLSGESITCEIIFEFYHLLLASNSIEELVGMIETI